MRSILGRYMSWLHTGWPAGVVEQLPEVAEDGSTAVPGLYIVGDLTGIPLLKMAADSGAKAVQRIAADPAFQTARRKQEEGVADVAIVGASVSGMAAALEAEALGLSYVLLEASEPFSTIVNFPKGKPIFTYPTDMTPAGRLRLTADVKEALVEELHAQTLARGIQPRHARVERVERRGGLLEVVVAEGAPVRARRVIVGIGRSGSFRKLGVPGEDLGKVCNRLHDPKEFAGQHVLVVGGGDSAVETAVALAQFGAHVALSYRKGELARAKPENVARLKALQVDPMADVAVERPVSDRVTTSTGRFMSPFKKAGTITLHLPSHVKRITERDVVLADGAGTERTLRNDAVFAMIGREPPLDFFRRSGVPIAGETSWRQWIAIAAFFLAMVAVYDWKNDGFLSHLVPALSDPGTFPNDMPQVVAGLSAWLGAKVADRRTLVGTLAVSMKSRSFYYTLAYTACIGIFGLLRMRRRRTPYVKAQTISLFLIQLVPLFLLPELVLPWLGYRGAFTSGLGKAVGDNLFELYIPPEQELLAQWPDWGHPRAYWRAYGFILAWPLMVYNVFTPAPVTWWLVICFVQTFVLIPLLVMRWGKGAYCGWICSCGGLAETLGDTQRHKMPHGPAWNRLNLVGQALLAIAFLLLAVRVAGWIAPESALAKHFPLVFEGKSAEGKLVNPLSWKWTVDVLMGGVLGVGLYFKYSGRVWCRFACPLAALMHLYARVGSFRILAEKKKCISCNVCTSVCHQGIDVMNFANKGLPMEDPECVRCSACVHACPTGTLTFGRIDRRTGAVIAQDRLLASPVHMREAR